MFLFEYCQKHTCSIIFIVHNIIVIIIYSAKMHTRIYRVLSDVERRLEYERERRERLEAELDQTRKQLQHTSAELLHTQSLLRQYKVKGQTAVIRQACMIIIVL